MEQIVRVFYAQKRKTVFAEAEIPKPTGWDLIVALHLGELESMQFWLDASGRVFACNSDSYQEVNQDSDLFDYLTESAFITPSDIYVVLNQPELERSPEQELESSEVNEDAFPDSTKTLKEVFPWDA